MTGSFNHPTTTTVVDAKNNNHQHTESSAAADYSANHNVAADIAARRGYEVNEEVLQRWEAKRRSADGGGQFVWRITAPKQAGDREEVRMKALQLAALNAYKAATAPRPPHYVPADRTARVERRS
jgi:hypothetical protein